METSQATDSISYSTRMILYNNKHMRRMCKIILILFFF